MIIVECQGFDCGDGGCIPLSWQCNGMENCLDGLDEMNCEGTD